MSQAGNDLWSRQAVTEMSGTVFHAIPSELDGTEFVRSTQDSVLTNGHLEEKDGAEGNTEETPNGTDVIEDSRRGWLLQNLFDMLYLRRVFSHQKGDDLGLEALSGLVGSIRQQLGLDDASNFRLQKSADEYWKRTYLLFGLLAPSGD